MRGVDDLIRFDRGGLLTDEDGAYPAGGQCLFDWRQKRSSSGPRFFSGAHSRGDLAFRNPSGSRRNRPPSAIEIANGPARDQSFFLRFLLENLFVAQRV